jgi:hypothetical protein
MWGINRQEILSPLFLQWYQPFFFPPLPCRGIKILGGSKFWGCQNEWKEVGIVVIDWTQQILNKNCEPNISIFFKKSDFFFFFKKYVREKLMCVPFE